MREGETPKSDSGGGLRRFFRRLLWPIPKWRDDRGNVIELWRSLPREVRREFDYEKAKEAYHAMMGSRFDPSRLGPAFVANVFSIFLTTALVDLTHSNTLGFWPRHLVQAAMYLIFFRVCLAAVPDDTKNSFAMLRLVYLPHHGRCGACGYPVRDLPKAADGCTVCPECGAAWRMDSWLSMNKLLRGPAVVPRPAGHPYVHDALRRRVPLFAGRPPEVAMRAIDQAIRGFPKRIRSATDWKLTFLWLAMFAVVFAASRAAKHSGDETALLLGVLSIPLSAVVAFMAHRQLRSRSVDQLIQQSVAEGKCPCCEQRLEQTEPGIAGGMSCAACGSMWKRQRDAGKPIEEAKV